MEIYDLKVTIMDIGAASPDHTRWKKFNNKYIIGFEPNAEQCAFLKNTPKELFLNTAVYDYTGEVTLNITKYWSNISILMPNRALIKSLHYQQDDWDIVGQENVPCDTLDSICTDKLKPDFIKIDTQGTELAILKAGKNVLASTFGLEIEVEFLPLYERQPLFVDVHSFLSSYSFVLMDYGNMLHVKNTHSAGIGGQKSNLISADALYFKSKDAIIEQAQDGLLHSLSGIIATCVAYGYEDYAYEICLELEEKFFGIFPEAAKFIQHIDSYRNSTSYKVKRALQRNYFAKKISSICRKVFSKLKYTEHAHWLRRVGN